MVWLKSASANNPTIDRASLARSREHETHGQFALEAVLRPGGYPGIPLTPDPDWTGGVVTCSVGVVQHGNHQDGIAVKRNRIVSGNIFRSERGMAGLFSLK